MKTVYFVAPIGGGLVKIGCSETPASRLGSLLLWSPVPLEIVATMPGDRATEAYFHFKFWTHRSHSEWFRPAEPVLAAAERVRATGRYPNAPVDDARLPWSPQKKPRGSRLPAIREQLGLSQRQLGEALGVKVSSVRLNEQPLTEPNASFAARVVALAEERGLVLRMSDFIVEHDEPTFARLKAIHDARSHAVMDGRDAAKAARKAAA